MRGQPGTGRLVPGQASRCDSCSGLGHLARGCPNHRRAGGADKTKLCSICGGTGHDSLDHRLPGVGCFEEQDLLDMQGGEVFAADGPNANGGAPAVAGDCWHWRNTGSCRFGEGCRFRHGPNDTRHAHFPGPPTGLTGKGGGKAGGSPLPVHRCDACDQECPDEKALLVHYASRHPERLQLSGAPTRPFFNPKT